MSSDPDSLITAGASDWTGNTSAVKKNYLKNHKTEKDKSEATGLQDEPRQTRRQSCSACILVFIPTHPGLGLRDRCSVIGVILFLMISPRYSETDGTEENVNGNICLFKVSNWMVEITESRQLRVQVDRGEADPGPDSDTNIRSTDLIHMLQSQLQKHANL